MNVYWVGGHLHVSGPEGRQRLALPPDDAPWRALVRALPACPEVLVLPIEPCLQLPFQLPLKHPRFVDAEMLGQELNDQTGEAPEDWWLCWQAVASGEGVDGLMFGLPAAAKAALSSVPHWDRCRRVLVDAWLRLPGWLAPADDQPCAVWDADREGAFVGFRSQGVWRGMRRLNRGEDTPLEDVSEEALRTLEAMGWQPEEHPVVGRLDGEWLARVEGRLHWRGETVEALPSRAEATLAALAAGSAEAGLNFRHGAWAARAAWRQQMAPWRRAAVLAALLVVAVVGRDAVALQQLRAREAALQAGVLAAFHRGLPDERVILDPLAQLRARAGRVREADVWRLLRQLRVVGEVTRRWRNVRVMEIDVSDKGVRLVGVAPELATANRIRDALAKRLNQRVQLRDTELEGKQARFRLTWP